VKGVMAEAGVMRGRDVRIGIRRKERALIGSQNYDF
jgi:hypothetical protein